MIECDADGKPIIVIGPGGKKMIKGPNGELIECDENGIPIKGGRVIKAEPGKAGYKIKNGKVVFDGSPSDDSDFDPDDPNKASRMRKQGKVKKRD